MLPIALDEARLRIALIGRGAAAVRRLGLLDAAGARDLAVFSDEPTQALADEAGDRLRRHLPDDAALAGFAIVYISDLPRADALAARARAAGALVNVEDDTALCDFHSPSIVRRGDLVLAISTGGRIPGLARALRQALEQLFDGRWAERIEQLADLRRRWREDGCTPQRVGALTEQLLARRGWLPDDRRDAA
jgi:precorrin-2 dehydrogenase/sirohydrochlorin ferrochelatase